MKLSESVSNFKPSEDKTKHKNRTLELRQTGQFDAPKHTCWCSTARQGGPVTPPPQHQHQLQPCQRVRNQTMERVRVLDSELLPCVQENRL